MNQQEPQGFQASCTQQTCFQQRILSEKEQAKIKLFLNKINQLEQNEINLLTINDHLLEQKQKYINQVNEIFDELKKDTINIIDSEFKKFELNISTYEKYQRYSSLSLQQLQIYLNDQKFNFTISPQVERICSMNLENLKLTNKKVLKSYEEDQLTLTNSISDLISNLKEQTNLSLNQQIQKQEGSRSHIHSIIEDLQQLQLRINPLDEREQQKVIQQNQNEYLSKYFINNFIFSKEEKENRIPPEQILESETEQIEQKEDDQENQENEEQREIIDECIQKSSYQLENAYQIIKTSHIMKEHPQRFNPQSISIPVLLTTSYYSQNIITGGWDGSIQVTSLNKEENNQIKKELFNGPVSSLVFLKSSLQIAVSGSEENRKSSRIVFLDYNNLDVKQTIDYEREGEKIIDLLEQNINENILESRLIAITESSIKSFRLSDYSLIQSIEIPSDFTVLKAKLVDEKNLFLGTQQGIILHYLLEQEFQLVNQIKAHSDWIHLLNVFKISDESIQILSGSYDGKSSLRLYDLCSLQDSFQYEFQTEIPSALHQLNQQRIILAISNTLYFYEQGELINSIQLSDLDEIQHISLLQNYLVVSGKSDYPSVILI